MTIHWTPQADSSGEALEHDAGKTYGWAKDTTGQEKRKYVIYRWTLRRSRNGRVYSTQTRWGAYLLNTPSRNARGLASRRMLDCSTLAKAMTACEKEEASEGHCKALRDRARAARRDAPLAGRRIPDLQEASASDVQRTRRSGERRNG